MKARPLLEVGDVLSLSRSLLLIAIVPSIQSLGMKLPLCLWGCCGWHIELLFATLKQRGLEIESSQLESMAAIQKLCIMALSVAVMILQLTLGRENTAETADLVFDASRQRFVEQLVPDVEGHTEKQKNPYPIGSLAWVAWLIARLGGWSGYRSQRPPGFQTMYRGLQQFEMMFSGWQLAAP